MYSDSLVLTTTLIYRVQIAMSMISSKYIPIGFLKNLSFGVDVKL